MAKNLFSQTGTPNDFLLEVLLGNIPGHTLINILGNNESLGSSIETIWDQSSDYIVPTVAASTTIESTDNVEDKAGGTGALTAEVFYLNTAFEEKSEVLALNGTTPVALGEDAIAVNNILVKTAGSTGSNVGKLIVKIDANDACVARPTENRSDGGIYTVPKGFTIVVNPPSYAASAGTEADAFVKFRVGENTLFLRRKLLSVFQNSLVANIKPVLALPEKSVIILQGIKLSGASPKLSGLVQLVKIDNNEKV